MLVFYVPTSQTLGFTPEADKLAKSVSKNDLEGIKTSLISSVNVKFSIIVFNCHFNGCDQEENSSRACTSWRDLQPLRLDGEQVIRNGVRQRILGILR
jgi:hypothetical protein